MSDSNGLGLLVDETPAIQEAHIRTIGSLNQLPVTFRAKDINKIPPKWETPITVFNQGQTSSCSGHAGAANFMHRQYVETDEVINYSPWFMYIKSQQRGGFAGRDQGTSIGSVLKAATLDGCCLQKLCRIPDHYTTVLPPEAVKDAAQHKHLGDAVDLRDFSRLMDWLTDLRSAIIGTKWYSSQGNVKNIETKQLGTGGTFRGYHARALIGWDTIAGELCPRVLNSHGADWGTNGRATIEHALWDVWLKDPNFVCLGFTDITERIPARRDWSGYNWVGTRVPDWINNIA